MSNPIDREGIFRGDIIDYGIYEAESGAIQVTISCRIREAWNGTDWEDWTQYDVVASGSINVIKRDSTTNEIGVRNLVSATGWDGTFTSIDQRTWQPKPCQFRVDVNTYKDKTTYQVGSLAQYDRKPGQLSNIDSSKVKSLDAKFGSALRAVAGVTPAATPAKAPAKPPAKAPVKQPVNATSTPPEDIPF